MVCLFVIAMIIRRSRTMIDDKDNNDTFGVDGSLITINNSTTNSNGPVGDPTVPDGMTPGQLLFPWKLWGYGVVRDYWDQRKDNWTEIEDELHRKVCLLHILLHVISCISSISCIYICCCTRMTIYSRHTIPWPTLHTVSFSSLFVYIDFSVTSANSEAPNRKVQLRI